MRLPGSANNWWLRSANSTTNFRYVNNNGNENNNNANNTNGVVFGFHIGFCRKSKYDKGKQNGIEGANNLPSETVNIQVGKTGRTFLAWSELHGILISWPVFKHV